MTSQASQDDASLPKELPRELAVREVDILRAYETAPDSVKTSHSEIELYLKCQRAHYYSYGMELQSKSTSDALIRGIIGHAMLADYYLALQNNQALDAASKAAMQVLVGYVTDDPEGKHSKIYRELSALFQHYVRVYGERDRQLDIIAVEQEFNIPVTDDFHIKMYVDLIAREPGEGITAWDHKFVYNFFNPEVEAVLSQLPKYMGALRSVGINIQTVKYNELRYQETAENKADPSKKFMRTIVPVNSHRVIRTMTEQVLAARQIRFLREQGLKKWEQSVLRAANSMICRNCAYLSICAADLRGDDTTLLQDFSYMKKERRIDPND